MQRKMMRRIAAMENTNPSVFVLWMVTGWLLLVDVVNAYTAIPPSSSSRNHGTYRNYQVSSAQDVRGNGDSAPLGVDVSILDSAYDTRKSHSVTPSKKHDPSKVLLQSTSKVLSEGASAILEDDDDMSLLNNPFPVAAMMKCSAPYIAAHLGKVTVVHLPGDILDKQPEIDSILSDLALSWVLGIKLVIVVGCRYDVDSCDFDFLGNSHECENFLPLADKKTLRLVEEEAGYLRTEVERKLNGHLRRHHCDNGNVVSGNLYTAQRFGTVNGEDFQYTGYAANVEAEKIQQMVDQNDIVLLTTVGTSRHGDLVDVNGYHLAAKVAASLDAHKLVYMANEGSIAQNADDGKPLQELPLSFAQSIVDYHNVKVYNTGFASFDGAREKWDSCSVELLLHLGWASWALGRGVTRAHIINPTDGAILEELFTTKNGMNTCLYHDSELEADNEDDEFQAEWNDYFSNDRKR